MTTVQLSDGSTAEFPDAMSPQDIQAALQQQFPPPPSVTQGQALNRGFFDRIINSVLNTPAGVGELLAAGSAGVQTAAGTIPRAVQGQPLEIGTRFNESLESERQKFPASALKSIEAPFDATDLRAFNQATSFAPESVLEGERPSFGERFATGQDEQAAIRAAAEEQFPGTIAAGETGGDVAMILGGRAPLARARVPGRVARRERLAAQFKDELANIPDNIKDEVVDILSSKIIPGLTQTGRQLQRAGGKALETGLEGAALAAINDGDVAATFGLAAGGQSVGSLGLFFVEKPIKRLFPTIGIAWAASEMFKAAAPGDQDFFESKDFAIQKAVTFFGLGMLGAVAGAGRLRGEAAERFPALLDAVTAVPRAALVSRLQELTNARDRGDNVPLAVMQRFARQPSFFNENQQNALGRAMKSEKKGAFVTEVNRLMKNPRFRKRVDSLSSNEPIDRLFRDTRTQPIQRTR